MDALPKIVQRTITSIKNSWTHENAGLLFDMIDDVHNQFEQMEYLSQSWQTFWNGLDDVSHTSLKEQFHHMQLGLPTVNFYLDAKPDFEGLKDWYEYSGTQLKATIDQAVADHPNDPFVQSLPSLFDQSQAWIQTNLY